jgi:putative oxidoreductase
MDEEKFIKFTSLFLRLALGITFLFSVADRFGLLGPHGKPTVYWGDFAHFTAYAAKVNSFLPQAAIPVVAWAATIAEFTLGLGLVLGVYQRYIAIVSGVLLLLFASAMTVSFGIQSALGNSVFTASAGAFVLATYRANGSALTPSWNRRLSTK